MSGPTLVSDFNQAIKLKNTKSAEESLEKFRRNAPASSYKLKLMEAKTLRISKETQKALEICKLLIKQNPSNIEAYLEVVQCLFDKNDNKWVEKMTQVTHTFRGDKNGFLKFYELLKEDPKVSRRESLILYCLEQLHVLDPFNTLYLIELGNVVKEKEVQLELFCRAYLVDKSEEALKGMQKVP
eukprot:NODE_39_length_35218_cov_0.479655.p31 type:complete len:184 gc:universal NODE_39_length_35218_cov_0.479655:21246-20695(-)